MGLSPAKEIIRKTFPSEILAPRAYCSGRAYCRSEFYDTLFLSLLACNCNPEGSLNVSCNEYGECSCKFGVLGIKCDSCEENKHNLTAGCISKYC